MTNERALTVPRRLVRRFHTRDPFVIADNLDIVVMFRNDFKRQKGAFKVIARNSFIFVNNNLSDEMQRLVCAHELGHAVLNRDLGMLPQGLLEFELFNITNQCEMDANRFAATILLDEEELIEYSKDGYDLLQIARAMDTNINLLLLKMWDMNRQGYDFNLPYEPSRGFLGRIHDNAGDI